MAFMDWAGAGRIGIMWVKLGLVGAAVVATTALGSRNRIPECR